MAGTDALVLRLGDNDGRTGAELLQANAGDGVVGSSVGMAAVWKDVAGNEAVILAAHDLEGAVGPWIDVVPTDHIAGPRLVVNGKVYGDLAGGEISGRLSRSDDVAAVSIGETIGADDLDLGPAVTAQRRPQAAYRTAVEAVLPVRV